MPKIKFNLNFGGGPIRSIEDLRRNFSAEDVMQVYRSGILARWLDVCGYPEELAQVRALQAGDDREALLELARILKADAVSDMPGRRAAVFQRRDEAVDPCLRGYDALVRDIDAHPEDLQYIYDRLDELSSAYPALLGLNAHSLFYHFLDRAPLASFALFAHGGTRPHFAFPGERLERDQHRLKYAGDGLSVVFYCGQFSSRCTVSPVLNVNRSSELALKLSMITTLLDMVEEERCRNHIRQLSKPFFSLPVGWNRLEPKGRKCMLLMANFSSYDASTRFAGADSHEEYSMATELSVRLPVLDGIDVEVKNNVGLQNFYYMEAR